MEAQDVAEQIQETLDAQRDEPFRTRAAIFIAVLAVLLAMASLGGENATKAMINANIHASDTWAFYQAKNIRQTSIRLAADELELLLPTLPPEQQAAVRRRIDDYRATEARYESEPVPEPNYPMGSGKKELAEQARAWEARRQHAQTQDPNFDYSTVFFQIAIVLGSVAIVATSRAILLLAGAIGFVATILMLNGFFLFFELPLGG
ncbi:MAG: DUF4337 domain-containing protein [Gemmatimonadetes bacterium]|nr:DUF4337 domain-containing protein [Gemmatimonadota bacterium]